MLRIGQKVVALRTWKWPDFKGPIRGEIYTIREVLDSSLILGRDVGLVLLLSEIIIKPRQWDNLDHLQEPAWYAGYFRPLVSTSKESERKKIINKLLEDCQSVKALTDADCA